MGVAAAAAMAFTGCSSMSEDHGIGMGTDRTPGMIDVNNSVISTLQTVPCTDAVALTTYPPAWNIRSMDENIFIVHSGRHVADMHSLPPYSPELIPGTVFLEPATADHSARVMEVIRYAPGSRSN